MAEIAASPRILRDYLLTIDVDDFQAATEQVLFAPSVQSSTWTGGDGVTHSDAAPSTWTVTVGYVQDWSTTGSLGQYLLENEGSVVTMTFQPINGSGPSFTADVTIVPGGIGGNNGAWPTTSAAMPCSKPTLVPEV